MPENVIKTHSTSFQIILPVFFTPSDNGEYHLYVHYVNWAQNTWLMSGYEVE